MHIKNFHSGSVRTCAKGFQELEIDLHDHLIELEIQLEIHTNPVSLRAISPTVTVIFKLNNLFNALAMHEKLSCECCTI